MCISLVKFMICATFVLSHANQIPSKHANRLKRSILLDAGDWGLKSVAEFQDFWAGELVKVA
jgi:hypothetical protein